MSTVLVVDDKELLRDSVGATLQRAGFGVVTAGDGASAIDVVSRCRPDAIVTDLKMPGMSGLDLLGEVRKIDEDLPVVMMTAFGTVETAVQALKLGAFDYITKPFEGDELVIAMKRALEHNMLRRENALLRVAAGSDAGDLAGGVSGLDRVIGDSPAMRRVKEQICAVAESHGTVLVCGESGTGKEVIAKAIHELSPRRRDPFLGVNCAALSEPLLESELFGHERGAFTGAEKLRKGRFELADRGTLLLDEISEVSTRVQAKLLRVLQERSLERVGSSQTIGVDVRVVATSNRDLPASVARGDFRQDLFFRLNVLPIHLPPLRDRLEDVPALADHFLAAVAARDGSPVPAFEPDAMEILTSYVWPGNVRELQNICERAAVLCSGDRIQAPMVRPWLLGDSPAPSSAPVAMARGLDEIRPEAGAVAVSAVAPASSIGIGGDGPVLSGAASGEAVEVVGRRLEEIERDAIVRTLRMFDGHRQRTAEALGIGVRTLGLKLRKWKELKLVESTL